MSSDYVLSRHFIVEPGAMVSSWIDGCGLIHVLLTVFSPLQSGIYFRLLGIRFGHDRAKNDLEIFFPCASYEVLVWLEERNGWSSECVEWD